MTDFENGASQKAPLLLEWWKPVVGYEGYYEVSNVGNVCRIKQSNVSRPGRHLKQWSHWDKRIFVILSKENINKTKKVHKLLVDAFLGGTPDGMTVHHKDDCCTNNRVSNFTFLSARDNWLDAYQKGLTPRGERSGMAKITESQAKEILSLRGKMTLDQISEKYGITGTAASYIWQGKNWTHLQTASEKASYRKMVRRGTDIQNAILTPEKVREIRRRKGMADPKALAQEYGVSHWTIYKLYFREDRSCHEARLSSLSAVAWISASVAPGRRTSRISSPSNSRRQARRLSAWLGRRDALSHGDVDRSTNSSVSRPQAHASVMV